MFGLTRKSPPPPLSAVLVAAGAATRMGGIDKQFAPLDGLPVVAHSIAQFEQCPLVAEIVIVCRREQLPDYYRMAQELAFTKVASVVGGGRSRQESVFAGIGACSEDAAFYAIHDGARPLVTQEEIVRCIEAAWLYGAAAVGAPVKDTIKCVGPDGCIRETPQRDSLRAIQTPQIFSAPPYRAAMERALAEGAAYTDDCQLMERCGHRVFVTPGGYQNIKITTPEDLVFAEAILRYREEGIPWVFE